MAWLEWVTPAITQDPGLVADFRVETLDSYSTAYPVWPLFHQTYTGAHGWHSRVVANMMETPLFFKVVLPKMPLFVTKYRYRTSNTATNHYPPRTWKLQGCNDIYAAVNAAADDPTWVDLSSVTDYPHITTVLTWSDWFEIATADVKAWKTLRFVMFASWQNPKYIAFQSLQLYGTDDPSLIADTTEQTKWNAYLNRPLRQAVRAVE